MRVILRIILVLGTVAGLVGLALIRGNEGSTKAAPGGAVPAVAPSPDKVAANGLVEGARPEVPIRPEVQGILKAIPVVENQDVSKGEILAELQNDAQAEEVALAAAEVTIARAQLDRLRNGERAERRKAVAAIEEAKRAIYQQTEADWKRTLKLLQSSQVSREQADRDQFAEIRARAEWDEAAAERALVEAPARADEVTAAEGRIAVAEARLRLAKANLGKTRLLTPTGGRVLRIYAEPGEIAGPNSAQPVLLLADLSRRRVRAFVEELDAPRVKVGQAAVVTSDGLPGREFAGKIAVTLPRMGQRGPQTGAASEYRDIYFREVIIDLDAGDELPLNLRVEARIDVGTGDKPR